MVQTDNDESDINPEKISLESMDIAAEKRDALKQIFPEIFTEDKIDFNQFKRVLGEDIDVGKERFGLQWAGKADCFRVIQSPSIATLKPELVKSVNFDDTENLFIEGDNLEVLKLLQRSYFGKVKMIYIDPPYNTGREFIYPDKYQENLETYLQYSGQLDSDGHRFSTNTERTGRFHSNWLNMIYPRLYLARNLLRDDGVIFISIDDNEQANLKKLCDEIFGEENFVGCAGRITKKSNNKGDFWAPNFDYILTYTRSIESAEKFLGGINYDAYNITEEKGERQGEKYQLVRMYMSTIRNRNPEQRFFITCPDGSKVIPPGQTFPPERPNLGDGIWRWTRHKMEQESDRIVIKEVRSSNLITEDGKPAKWNVYTKTYLSDVIANASSKPNNFIEGHINQSGSHELNNLDVPFDYSKPSSLIKYLIEISQSNKDDIILDFFSGSCTTADAVMQLNAEDGGNRKYIMVQLPEPCDEKSEAFKAGYQNIADIGRERIRRAGKKIIDSRAEKAEAQAKQTTDMLAEKSHNAKLDTGFKSFKLTKSNFRIWQGDTEAMENPETDIVEQLEMHVDHLNPESTKEDILYELLLNQGIDMTIAIEIITLAGKEIFKIAQEQGILLICLENQITQELIEAIADSNPQEIICLDKAFEGNDQLKTNAVHTFKTREHTHNQKIIFRTV